MKLKIHIAKSELAPEGLHAATVKSIKTKGEAKCIIEFELISNGSSFTVGKDYPAKLDRSSPLLRDAETILGQKLTDTAANEEFDLESLIDKPCQVFVQHKRSNGGKQVAAVETVLPAVNPVLKAA